MCTTPGGPLTAAESGVRSHGLSGREQDAQGKPGQKGSSAMPHKRNPILSENLSGLARLLRGYSLSALEDVPLWHERDISHSSVERVIGPDATNLISEFSVAMRGELTVDEISETIHPHPTLSEAVMEAAMAVDGRAIHI